MQTFVTHILNINLIEQLSHDYKIIITSITGAFIAWITNHQKTFESLCYQVFLTAATFDILMRGLLHNDTLCFFVISLLFFICFVLYNFILCPSPDCFFEVLETWHLLLLLCDYTCWSAANVLLFLGSMKFSECEKCLHYVFH